MFQALHWCSYLYANQKQFVYRQISFDSLLACCVRWFHMIFLNVINVALFCACLYSVLFGKAVVVQGIVRLCPYSCTLQDNTSRFEMEFWHQAIVWIRTHITLSCHTSDSGEHGLRQSLEIHIIISSWGFSGRIRRVFRAGEVFDRSISPLKCKLYSYRKPHTGSAMIDMMFFWSVMVWDPGFLHCVLSGWEGLNELCTVSMLWFYCILLFFHCKCNFDHVQYNL